MVIGNQDTGGTNSVPHPSGIPQDKIDNIMSGIANTGDVKMNNHRKKLRQRFDIIKKLGQGTYGKVQLGINKETGQEVAIKTIKKCKIEAESDLVRIRREVQIMSSVQHPNIIHIYEVFENREKMVLVMEFAAGGELYDYLSERKVLSEEEARRIFRQVATAVYYCHKHKICHRDLKLENILLDEHGNAKIADFGLSNVFDDQRLLATFCGSPLYASPEIVEGTPYHGPEVDCWSLGVLLYTLVYGSMPFDGSNFKRLVKQISQGDYYEPKKPSRASSLIREMLTVCPRKRANIEQICSHWWVNENDNVSCLELAEDLANQTPVRLDVLLSLTPAAVTAEQLVVPSAADAAAAVKGGAIPRSHSVGSIREIGPPTTTTEAERRILDMVAAGGEAALMPSPTRTITPAQSPIQTKRKLENTVSTENATGVALKKKEKPGSTHTLGGAAGDQTTTTSTIVEEEPTPMETEESAEPTSTEPLPPSAAGDVKTNATRNFSVKDIQAVGDICEQLIQQEPAAPATSTIPAERYSEKELVRQLTSTKLDATSVEEDPDKTKGATKVIKKFVNKHKTADLVNVIGKIDAEESAKASETAKPKAGGVEPATKPFVRKCSLQDESPLNKFNNERRKSRIMETAEKFQAMNAATGQASDKPKKLVIPGVSVGSYKKEYERKASTPAAGAGQQQLTAGERRALEEVAAAAAAAAAEAEQNEELMEPSEETSNVEASDSKASVSSFSLEDARKSMENSIALIRQAQSESSKEVNNLCAKPEYEMPQVAGGGEREQKLKNARTIIGNAIQPVLRHRPQSTQPLACSSSYFGNGGGGYDQMRANSGSYIGFGGNSINAGKSLTGNEPMMTRGNKIGYNDTIATPIPTPQSMTMRSRPAVVQHSTTLPANANAAALAAARQTLMGRLAAGGIGSFPPTTTPMGGNDQHYNHPQHHNHHHHHQQQQTKSLHSMHAPSFYASAVNSPSSSLHTPPTSIPPPQPPLSSSYTQHPLLATSFGPNAATATNAISPNAKATKVSNQQQQQQQQTTNNKTNTTSSTITSNSSNVINTNSTPKPFYNASSSQPLWKTASASQGISDNVSNAPAPAGTMKTSTASITLKSATLPRRKVGARSEIQLDIKPPPPIVEQSNMRFTTEMQHPIADLRSAPPREGPVPYSPIKNMASGRASSLEPKEHIIHIQKPPSTYMRTTSNTTTRSGSLSRQSTNDSESDTTSTANMSQSTITGSSQPIKKSPREFIIPIAVEGGGFITPREGSIEPSDSSHTAATSTSSRSTFTRLKPTRRIGSLLSETGVDDSSPFQKLRTSSTNRDNDDDTRFTLHKLRSSRPVKKLSQDNDSQSSGEEDDDDGFEILTAENLFSTLLQRVRALTNRMNVNNDLTSAFPSSSRLLSNMRQTQSPFWNQDPFGSRLNTAANSMGVPWRHSMSRDLGSDMESMFSRTGATLPRGKSSNADKKSKSIDDGSQLPDEPLDLADLDLSRLRLSKTDLETLSSIAPGLPKCFQEQLLAKLPPTQARKLSRTLSVQAGQCPPTRIYKRSQSSGRPGSTLPVTKTEEERKELSVAKDKVENVNGIRDDFATKEETKLESTNQECSGKDPCPLYSSEVNEKYKYYSPYVKKSSKDILGNTEIPSMLGRPPSGRISPSASMESTGAVAKRPSQRRISRLLRPDFMEQPLEESPVEASGMTPEEPVKPGIESLDAGSKLKHTRHVRNKSLDLFSEKSEGIGSQQDTLKRNRRSLSRPREFDESEKLAKHELADKILQELQLLSTIRSQQERLVEEESSGDITEPTLVENKEKTVAGTSTLKKVKKVKPKEKSTESSTDADKTITNTSNTTTTVVKKVKKVVVKKSETPKTSAGDNIPGSDTTAPKSLITDLYSPKNVSKLKRPKSYPTKDSNATENSGQMDMVSTKIGPAIVETPTENSTSSGQEINAIGGSSTLQRESRLLRPKSYPTSKLMAPKELKKPSKPRLANMEGGGSPEESNTPPTAMVLKPSATTPSSSANPESVAMLPEVSPAPKKVLKITKKSKLSPPTAISSTSSASNTNSSVGDDSKESSPAAPSTKETPSNKLVEKKPNKGLLYAIGQKFEKLRASATSNSCANIPTTQKKAIGQSNDNSQSTSPEKTSGKYSFVKKTKSLGSSVTKKSGTPTAGEGDGAGSKETKTPGTGDTTKPIKADKRSRIDAMIRNLRERSVPRSQPIIHSESTYIKRAVSVEEMPGTFNRKSVNKVLGLFKRYEKDNSANRVRTARSASNIQRQITDSTDTSPIYQNADAILKLKEKEKFTEVERKSAEKSRSGKSLAPCNCTPPPKSSSTANDLSNCPECIENTLTSNKLKPQNSYPSLETQTLQGNKDRRKGLMLELSDKSSKLSTPSTAEAPVAGRNSKKYSYINDNEIYSNLPPYPRSTTNIIHSSSSSSTAAANQDNNNIGHLNNNNNNNTLPTSYNNNSSSLLSSSQTTGYRSLTTSTGHEAPPLSTCSTNQTNNNLMSPSFDNIANYSSDSRSYQEDCASTSTFRSPTEEPELYFDNWSVCSEDNYRMHGGGGATPSPAVSRLSRTSQVSSPTRRDGESSDPNESIVDRIRRRSFYCRFNEKKPKRTSSIVGPNAVREYYREQQAAAKTRSSNKIYPEERARSPDITQEFFRPLKLSPIGTELKPPVYKSPYASHEYTLTPGRPRKSLNDIRAPTSPSGLSERRYATSGSSTYNTPEKDIMPHTAILSSRYKTTLGDDSSNLSKAGGGGGSGLASTTAYYNTYNPKRRFSYNTANGSSTSSAAAAGSNLTSTGGHIDGYATMGRRPIRAYDHRTMSLLEPGSSSSYRHDANTPLRDYTTSLSRSNSRYRTQSSSRSPTNI
ncbi:mucin-12 isoform X3 [Musca domestica]|uniref:Mucin-12 isoform X3 n=1 Tax=Musca domestica TaxID=7370 RepID=A0ABM3UQD5_MUSDO|nr:mucin-12 isoform X3 [Musca domestica]